MNKKKLVGYIFYGLAVAAVTIICFVNEANKFIAETDKISKRFDLYFCMSYGFTIFALTSVLLSNIFLSKGKLPGTSPDFSLVPSAVKYLVVEIFVALLFGVLIRTDSWKDYLVIHAAVLGIILLTSAYKVFKDRGIVKHG